MTIAMTAPVTTKVIPASAPDGATTFTRSFYIPYDLQEDPPKPTNADVFLYSAAQETVYVRWEYLEALVMFGKLGKGSRSG